MKKKVKIKDIALYSKGTQINGDELLDEAKFDYLNGGIKPSGKWDNANCVANTVTISEGGNSCGYVNFMKNPFWCGAHCYFLYDTKIDSKYLYYALKSQQVHIMKLRSGACMPNIKKTDLGNFEFVCDDNSIEQKKITHILDKLECVIEQRKNEIQVFDELVKARFIEVFGDAIHNPMEWPVKKLGELSSQINSGNTPKGGQQVYVDKGITFFRSQNVWKNKLEMDDIAYIDEATHASMSRSSLKHGDILMTKTGRINTENSSLGRAALYMGKDDAANVNGHVYFIRLKPGINNKFILRILISDEYRDYIRSVCVGGIDKRQLNKEHIEDFPIICPPVKLIEKYIAFTEQADKSKLSNISIIYTLFVGMAYTLPGTLALYLCAKLSPVNGDMGVPFQVRSRYFSRLAVLKLS